MDGEMYLLHHQLPLVHRGRPWEGATMWKINVYIYIITILYICICVFFSLFSSFFFFFFFATCRSLIRCQSRRSVSSRWEPRVIFGLACIASYAQVSSLYIVEFLRYPLHLQNLLLWPSSSRALSRSFCVQRLLSARSRYLLFSSSLGSFPFLFFQKCLFLFLRPTIVRTRL